MDELIHIVKGLAIFNENKGGCIFSKYYSKDFRDNSKKQKEFEETLHKKVQKISSFSEPEVVSFQKNTCVFQSVSDLLFCVIGSDGENELILSETLVTFIDALNRLFENKLEKRTLLENFDLILLTLDELIDEGVILENESTVVAQRVDKTEGLGISEDRDPLLQVVNSAKKTLKTSLRDFTNALFG